MIGVCKWWWSGQRDNPAVYATIEALKPNETRGAAEELLITPLERGISRDPELKFELGFVYGKIFTSI